MRVIIHKAARTLTLQHGHTALLSIPVGLGRMPAGAKQQEGDGKTPEGSYFICLIKPDGKYGRSLGLSYPNTADAATALEDGRINYDTYQAITDAQTRGVRPPWGTALGGEIYIHEGGAASDWTQGCIALNAADMDKLYPYHPQITAVEIYP